MFSSKNIQVLLASLCLRLAIVLGFLDLCHSQMSGQSSFYLCPLGKHLLYVHIADC